VERRRSRRSGHGPGAPATDAVGMLKRAPGRT
jgi:hypothetical protein